MGRGPDRLWCRRVGSLTLLHRACCILPGVGVLGVFVCLGGCVLACEPGCSHTYPQLPCAPASAELRVFVCILACMHSPDRRVLRGTFQVDTGAALCLPVCTECTGTSLTVGRVCVYRCVCIVHASAHVGSVWGSGLGEGRVWLHTLDSPCVWRPRGRLCACVCLCLGIAGGGAGAYMLSCS